MDEADRMIDMGFEEDVRTIFSFFQVHLYYLCNYKTENVNIQCIDYQCNSRVKDKHYCFLLLCQKKFKTLLDLL